MMKNILFTILLLLSLNFTFAQSDPYADSVVTFNKGTGSWINQNPPYFPDNVLGAPSRNASYTVPAVSPDEICSLGLGGEIILAFTNNAIVNGEGPDFTVFENAFEILYGTRAGEIFAEPGKVAVSKDGINFFEFPFDSLTLIGCAGITPTDGNADPTNPDSSGGDSFDLSVVGLDTAYYVKITDITNLILSDTSHPYYDFTANGFDLDAVVATNSANIISAVPIEENTNKVNNFNITVFPNPINKSKTSTINFVVHNLLKRSTELTVYNLLGQKIFSRFISDSNSKTLRLKFNAGNLPTGIYFVTVKSGKNIIATKFMIIK